MESIINLMDDERLILNGTIKILLKNLDFFVVRFYDYLISTDIGPLFQHTTMEKQQQMFATSLNIILDYISNPNNLEVYVKDLAIRHKNYGVLVGHADYFIDSFMTALMELLGGEDVDPNYFDVWYRVISDVLGYFQEKLK